MTLHADAATIEKHCLDCLAMYENAKWPTPTTRGLADHWRGNLKAIRDYQAGLIDAKALPLAVKEIGWKMPAWGTYGT